MKPIEMAEEEFPIAEEEADEIAEGLSYTGYTSLRVFSDGRWISPATGTVLDAGLDFWNYTWTVDGYRPDRRSEVA